MNGAMPESWYEDAFAERETDQTEVNQARRILRIHMKGVLDLVDPSVTEIMANGADSWWRERAGSMERVATPLDAETLTSVIVLLGRLEGRYIGNHTEKWVTVRLGHALRAAAAIAPLSVEGPSLCLRVHRSRATDLGEYADPPPGAADRGPAARHPGEDLATLFRRLAAEKRTVIVSGSTGSGKTTFANAYLAAIPPQDRILVIEDTPELRVEAANRVRFEASGANDARALLALALRYRPDRIVLGEVRGVEAYDLVQAFNTGHPGGVSTIHANSAEDALYRLEALVTQSEAVRNWPLTSVRRAISRAVDIVVSLSRYRVKEVVAVEGLDERGEYRIRSIAAASAN
ncbi:MAG: ATPase, T2SS/T4P/T4SS family [Acidiferrobacterales bacterium]